MNIHNDGTLNYPGNASPSRMIDVNQRIGLGDPNPAYPLHVINDHEILHITADGRLWVNPTLTDEQAKDALWTELMKLPRVTN